MDVLLLKRPQITGYAATEHNQLLADFGITPLELPSLLDRQVRIK